MKMLSKFVSLIAFTIILFGCAPQAHTRDAGNDLLHFSKANCIYWYLNDKGYDTTDIRAITGGIVEMSVYSPDKFQEVAILVKNYAPEIKMKHQPDPNLVKCFILDADSHFLNELHRIQQS